MVENNNALQEFLQGTSCASQDYFGVHEVEDGFVFRTYAPRASQVMLTGDFNGWRDDIFLNKIDDSGVWEVKLPFGKVNYGDRYKYRIYGFGQLHYKSDPFSRSISQSPDNSSVICENGKYVWKDSGWLNYRKSYQKNISTKPINIYELHLGSWKKRGKHYLNYRDYARELAPYVKQMGYTHICLLSINESSNNDTAGYMPSAFFAPTSRYGSPDDLKAFVDKLHEAGLGVIFDVPISSFSREQYGLFEFDGAPLYECECGGESCHFDFSKNITKSFITSSVLYWINEYHADAIRLSDVDGLLNANDDRSELSRSFLQKLLKLVKKSNPDVLLLADNVNKALGFDIVFDSAFAEDMIKYASIDFADRAKNYSLLTNTLGCNGETVSLPCEVQRGALDTLIEASEGDYWQKFAGARALLGLMITMRGKKLSFMGNEIAQFRKWDAERETEWFLLDFESHEKFQRYVAELNNFYLAHSALWQKDASPESFCFVDRDGFKQNVITFRRSSKDEELLVVANLTPTAYEHYRIGAQGDGEFYELFNSDNLNFYGSGVINTLPIATDNIEYHGYKNSFCMRVPPMAISILGFKPNKSKKYPAI